MNKRFSYACNMEEVSIMRDNTRRLLQRYFESYYANRKAPDPDVVTKICTDLEKSIVRRAITFSDNRNFTASWNNPRFRSLYNNVARNIALWLAQCADRMMEDACDDEFCDAIAAQNSYDMFPGAWRRSVDAHNERMQSAYQTRVRAKTTQFRCPKCKNYECDFYEMQCRSADESMTLFITCLTCNHKWRLG